MSERNQTLSAEDAAYAERNHLVAALSNIFPAGIKKTAIEGWDEAWHNCIYIDLPTGQVSWHIHDREMAQFEKLPAYDGEWDGHDTPEKYRRLAAMNSRSATLQTVKSAENLTERAIEIICFEASEMGFTEDTISEFRAGQFDGDDLLTLQAVERALTAPFQRRQ